MFIKKDDQNIQDNNSFDENNQNEQDINSQSLEDENQSQNLEDNTQSNNEPIEDENQSQNLEDNNNQKDEGFDFSGVDLDSSDEDTAEYENSVNQKEDNETETSDLDKDNEDDTDEDDTDYENYEDGQTNKPTIKDKLDIYIGKGREFCKNKLNKESMKKYIQLLKNDRKPIFYILASIVALLLIMNSFYGISLYANYQALNEKTDSLAKLSEYDEVLSNLNIGDKYFNKYINGSNITDTDKDKNNNINNILKLHYALKDQKNNISTYFNQLQSPYNNFLTHLFLPSANIWKDKYTGKIDKSIVGQEFMNKNKYLDTNLISKWSEFFQDVGTNNNNNVTDISIGDINKLKNGFFSIGIDVSFEAPTRRTFIMLIDKLSITSNKRNISLINELTYNIWENIKEQKNFSSTGTKLNKKIGEEFYRWVKEGKENNLINQEIILQSMSDSANSNCNILGNNSKNDLSTSCYYDFRNKFSSIPYLAYTLGDPNLNPKEELRKFYKNLPPIINVDSFSFRKKDQTASNINNIGYVGEISIKIYGKGIDNNELNELSSHLGNKCLGKGEKLNSTNALNLVNKLISDISEQESNIDSTKINDLSEIKNILEDINKGYTDLINFEKAKKIFEIYRMLNNNGLCNS